jgi:hypothetical protein
MCGRSMQVLPVINKSTTRAPVLTGFGLAFRDSALSDDKISGEGHSSRRCDAATMIVTAASVQSSDKTPPVDLC